MTAQQAVRQGESVLKNAGIEDAAADAWLLLSYVMNWTRTDYLLRGGDPLPAREEEAYRQALARRAEHIPLQHITGRQDFMGFTFQVDERVLIPRWDTEVLVQEASCFLKPGIRVLDLCTGSGCIAVSLEKLYVQKYGRNAMAQQACFAAADLSADALEVAAGNAKRLEADVLFLQGDLYEAAAQMPPFDMIVSNPPYIPASVIPTLSEEVRLHDPHIALDGGEDGLDFYRRIVNGAREHLRQDGVLLLEIGADQAAAVTEMLRVSGFDEIKTVQDLAGLDRVVRARISPAE